jgi:hypothetical protein
MGCNKSLLFGANIIGVDRERTKCNSLYRMSHAALTEERLRGWLDSNQVQRERMCLALLSLDKRYSRIEPRRPKGGPDGARDIQAIYQDKYLVWGAVGFRNSATDSSEDKKWASKKFKNDVEAAQKGEPSLWGLVFFTNIDLTPTEVQALKEYGASKGLHHTEIWYRERLRVLLDSSKGYAYRLQYLDSIS